MDQLKAPYSQNGKSCDVANNDISNPHELNDNANSLKNKGDKKEIYTYESPWTIYAMSLSPAVNPSHSSNFRVALGSFEFKTKNKIEILERDGESGDFTSIVSFPHDYPATNLMWCPKTGKSTSIQGKELIASSGDMLRLWSVSNELSDINKERNIARFEDNAVQNLKYLNEGNKTEENNCANIPGLVASLSLKPLHRNDNNSKEKLKHNDYIRTKPMTSLDWNEDDITMIATSSCDTSCTIWDIEKEQPKYQIFGHEKEVFDIEFAPGSHIFGSVSADASLRIFDLRNLKHSSILYESAERKPLMRLSWNKLNPNYMATFSADSQQALLLDLRKPLTPIAELHEHLGSVNAIAWAPHSSMHVCTASDDHHALIWDVSDVPNSVESPILAYAAEKEVNNLKWFYQSFDTNWVAISFDKKMQLLRV